MFSTARAALAARLLTLGKATQIAVLLAIGIFFAVVLFWSLNQVVYYLVARSYVEEISDAFDLNRHLAQALLWASFAAVVVFAGWALSLNSRKRMIGNAGIGLLLIGHSLVVWYGVRDNNFTRTGDAVRCYVLTRNNVKILNHVGVDPDTGRQCRPITPQMAEKVKLYQSGKRPTAIAAVDPEFFDPLSGEPVVWYAKSAAGAIEIFDLMGFHPRTGDELIPIDRQVVESWKAQNDKVIRRAARPVDPDKYAFFDPTNGTARVWYFVHNGEYEFYDGPGFHQRTGEALKIITRDAIDSWKKAREDANAKKKSEDERIAQQKRADEERLVQQRLAEKQLKQKRDEEARLAQQAAADAARVLREAGDNCDRLAANPTDARRVGDGAPFEVLRAQADQAIDACAKAVQQHPGELRFQYQLGRATQVKDRRKAFDIFSALVRQRYPAAYDNLGWMYWFDRKDKAAAVQMFKAGAALDDADSIVSLADMVDKGEITSPDPTSMKIALLARAAELGHRGAQTAVQIEVQKAQQAQADRVYQQQTNQQMMQMIGTIIGGAIRR